jgi:transcriptional regulator NrdR family protein
MVCIYCAAKTKVINSRKSKLKLQTWRRHQCVRCHSVFTTHEQPDYETSLKIQNSSGDLKGFQRDRLFLDVYFSVSHRKTAQTDATQLTDTILNHVLPLQKDGLLPRAAVIRTTSSVLNHFDRAAGAYFDARHQ